MMKIVDDYIAAVLDGRRIAGRYEKLAVQRYLSDMEKIGKEDFPYRFDEKKATRFVKFVGVLRHYKGEWAGQQIKLEGWQAFILWNVFGWVRLDGYRRFTYADVEVARKNGKTTLASAIALGLMLIDGESAAEVYAAATDREQAKICWEGARRIAESSPLIAKEFKYYTFSIVHEVSLSAFKPLSKDSKTKDGLNPHGAVCDERHAWKTNEMLDVLKSGMGARRQPLVFSISTAGRNLNYPYFEDLQKMKAILEGSIVQENHFVMIFELDKDDDWHDKRVWTKANPNIGVSCSWEFMEGEFLDAINKGGSYEINFKTKNLNQWVDSPEVWIEDDKVAACDHGTKMEDLEGEMCYVGLDFASHIDVIAMELWFPELENKPVLSFFWLPEAKLRDSTDLMDYRAWYEQGYLRVTEGEVIDIDYIVADILDILQQYNVQNIAFDPYKAYHGLIQGLSKGGLSELLSEFGQSIKNMSEPTKELQRMVLAREIDLMGNPVLRWMFRNVVIYTDPNGNIKLNKSKSINKIDGVVALVNAIGGYLAMINGGDEIYTDHELRFINI